MQSFLNTVYIKKKKHVLPSTSTPLCTRIFVCNSRLHVPAHSGALFLFYFPLDVRACVPNTCFPSKYKYFFTAYVRREMAARFEEACL